MPSKIPILWSNDIGVPVLSPLTILRAQADILGQRTSGLLQAVVSTVNTDVLTQHQLDVVALAINYRHRLLTATHAKDLVYPVVVEADCFAAKPRHPWESPGSAQPSQGEEKRTAATQDEFIELVREVLQSGEVRSLLQALIARCNEAVG